MDPGFSEGGEGGLTAMHGRNAVARGGCHGSFCHVCLTFVADIIIFAPFIAARFLLVCVFRELAMFDAL